MKTTPFFFALVTLLLQASCSTGSRAGHVVSEKIVYFGGKRFVQQRIVLTTDPYETELRTVQLR